MARWMLAKVNVDENPQTAQAFRVQGIPAVYAVSDGKVVDGFVGAQGEDAVREFVARLSGGAEPSRGRPAARDRRRGLAAGGAGARARPRGRHRRPRRAARRRGPRRGGPRAAGPHPRDPARPGGSRPSPAAAAATPPTTQIEARLQELLDRVKERRRRPAGVRRPARAARPRRPPHRELPPPADLPAVLGAPAGSSRSAPPFGPRPRRLAWAVPAFPRQRTGADAPRPTWGTDARTRRRPTRPRGARDAPPGDGADPTRGGGRGRRSAGAARPAGPQRGRRPRPGRPARRGGRGAGGGRGRRRERSGWPEGPTAGSGGPVPWSGTTVRRCAARGGGAVDHRRPASWCTPRAPSPRPASTAWRRGRGWATSSRPPAAPPRTRTSTGSTSPRRSATASACTCPGRGRAHPRRWSPEGGSAADGTAAATPAPVPLNSAGAEELQTLPGIGPATAAAILEHRRAQRALRQRGRPARRPGDRTVEARRASGTWWSSGDGARALSGPAGSPTGARSCSPAPSWPVRSPPAPVPLGAGGGAGRRRARCRGAPPSSGSPPDCSPAGWRPGPGTVWPGRPGARSGVGSPSSPTRSPPSADGGSTCGRAVTATRRWPTAWRPVPCAPVSGATTSRSADGWNRSSRAGGPSPGTWRAGWCSTGWTRRGRVARPCAPSTACAPCCAKGRPPSRSSSVRSSSASSSATTGAARWPWPTTSRVRGSRTCSWSPGRTWRSCSPWRRRSCAASGCGGGWRRHSALLVLFAAVTRFEPSVLRATAMAALAAVGVTVGRPGSTGRLLALAVAGLVVVDPLLVHSLGFRLSVAATAGIVVLAGPLHRALPGPPAGDRAPRGDAGGAGRGRPPAGARLRAHAGRRGARQRPRRARRRPGDDVGHHGGPARRAGAGSRRPALHLPTRLGLWWVAGVARVGAAAPLGRARALRGGRRGRRHGARRGGDAPRPTGPRRGGAGGVARPGGGLAPGPGPRRPSWLEVEVGGARAVAGGRRRACSWSPAPPRPPGCSAACGGRGCATSTWSCSPAPDAGPRRWWRR